MNPSGKSFAWSLAVVEKIADKGGGGVPWKKLPQKADPFDADKREICRLTLTLSLPANNLGNTRMYSILQRLIMLLLLEGTCAH